MWDGSEKIAIRLTMLTDDESLRFRWLGSNETILDDTVTKTNSGMSLACDPESRVVIEATDVTEFNVAVVFDLLGHKDEAVGYSYLSRQTSPVTQSFPATSIRRTARSVLFLSNSISMSMTFRPTLRVF